MNEVATLLASTLYDRSALPEGMMWNEYSIQFEAALQYTTGDAKIMILGTHTAGGDRTDFGGARCMHHLAQFAHSLPILIRIKESKKIIV